MESQYAVLFAGLRIDAEIFGSSRMGYSTGNVSTEHTESSSAMTYTTRNPCTAASHKCDMTYSLHV